MEIKSLFVNNFRGMNNFQVLDFSRRALIIGKNDSGKTNICMAIRKLLDPHIRRIPFNEADSTNSNKEDITIKVVLLIDPHNKVHRSILGTSIDRDNTITIKLIGKFNLETQLYDETVFLGTDDSISHKTDETLSIDKILDLIYVDPSFNISEDKYAFFKFRSSFDKENDQEISPNVSEKVDSLNLAISNEKSIQEINSELCVENGFQDLFCGMKFKTTSNINPTNIYKSLDIVAYDDINKKYNNIGDGKSKTLSLLLKSLSRKQDKEVIFIVEEPENHLYPQLQRQFASLLDSLNPNQIIITTHSPSIIDFNKMRKIFKLSRSSGGVMCSSLNIDDFTLYGAFANEDLAQMLFYDKVLLVEGASEKYFYNRLMIEDETFLKYCSRNNFGVFAVGGIGFKPYRELLSKLNIIVYTKTDNDIFKVPKIIPVRYRYAGLKRVFDCLNQSEKDAILKLLGENADPTKDDFLITANGKNIINDIESNALKIQEKLKTYGIYFSTHHEGFERDFLEFINEYSDENLALLREAKLLNLHRFIEDKRISLKINPENKKSILVAFMNQEGAN